MNVLQRAALGTVIAALAASAHAIEIRWTFADLFVQDPDALPVSGSFVFDASTGSFSEIALTTPAGPLLAGATYVQTGPDSGSARINFFAPGTSLSYVFDLGLQAPLPDAPATLTGADVAFGAEWSCSGSSACAFGSAEMAAWRSVSSSDLPILVGTLLTPIPEPGTLAMLSLGGAVLAWRRRRPAR